MLKIDVPKIEVPLHNGVTLHKVRMILEWTDHKTGETVESQTVLIGPFENYLYTETGPDFENRQYKMEFQRSQL